MLPATIESVAVLALPVMIGLLGVMLTDNARAHLAARKRRLDEERRIPKAVARTTGGR